MSDPTNAGAPLAHDLDALVAECNRAFDELHGRTRERWQRSLPFDELLFDRWARARSLAFGEGTSVYHNSYVYGDVRVGKGSWIGPFTLLDGSGGLTIGDYCSISAGVQIYTHDTVMWALTAGQASAERSAVHIGDCTYIGSQTVVAKGVTIGDHVVIGACSFVNRDIAPGTVAFGVPCRPAGRVVFDEQGQPRLDLKTGAAR